MALNLNDLLDVVISSPTNKQALIYNSSTSKWNNISQDLSYISSFNVSSPTNQQLLAYNTSTSKWINSTPTLTYNSDINISSPADGEFLIYDAASSKWKNSNTLVAKNVVQLESIVNNVNDGWIAGTPTRIIDWEKVSADVNSTIGVVGTTITITATNELTSAWTHRYGNTQNVMYMCEFVFTGLFSPQIHIRRTSPTNGFLVRIDKTSKHITIHRDDDSYNLLDELLDFINIGDTYQLLVFRYNETFCIVIYDITTLVVRYMNIIIVGMGQYNTSIAGGLTGISGLGSDATAIYTDFCTHEVLSPIYFTYYGDQNNMGYALTEPGNAHPFFLKKYCMYHDLLIKNVGYPNATAQILLDNIQEVYVSTTHNASIKVLILFIGQNDIENGATPEAVITTIAEIISILKTANNIWLATNYPRTDNVALNDNLRTLAKYIRSKSGADRVIHTWRVLADPANDNACVAGYLQADGKNLTDLAHTVLSQLIYDNMRQFICNRMAL